MRGGALVPSTGFSIGFGDSTRDGTGVALGGGGSEDTGVGPVGVTGDGGFGAVPPTLGPPDGVGSGPRGLLPSGSSTARPLSFLFWLTSAGFGAVPSRGGLEEKDKATV